MPEPSLVLWLNGPPGAGKSTVANRLHAGGGWRRLDLEVSGRLLQRSTRCEDYQYLRAWQATSRLAVRLMSSTRPVVVPMTLLDPSVRARVIEPLRDSVRFLEIHLTARRTTLEQRIVERGTSTRWCLENLDRLMRYGEPGIVIDTGACSSEDCTEVIRSMTAIARR